MKLEWVLSCLLLIISTVSSTVYYADSNYGGPNPVGTSTESPFSTIQECVDALERPGDQCRIRGGRYHESVEISGKHGLPSAPFIIAGYNKEMPVIDGTVVMTGSWNRYKNGIYKTKINQDITQLFIDNIMMTNARWPNALWTDRTVFNVSFWARSSPKSKRGKMIDDGSKNLAGSGLNATGAMAILNVGSFDTFTAQVEEHEPGSPSFTYKDTFGKLHFKPKQNVYFLEDKLEFLDQPGEWFYSKTDKILYVWTNDGTNPQEHDVRGKTQTYAFSIQDSRYTVFANMTFFATTLFASTLTSKNYIDHLYFTSLNFTFPSYSKRMLGVTDPPLWTIVNGWHESRQGVFNFFNNTFYGTDGVALQYSGQNVTLENNLFEYNDWTGANMKVATGGMGTIVSKSSREWVLRNTLRYNGANGGYRMAGLGPIYVKLNHIHHQCWGNIQNDGSGVQTQRSAQTGSIFSYNWVHSSPKFALRFDAGRPPKLGHDGTMTRNVAWKTGGLMLKGYHHTADHNLAFDKVKSKRNTCALCVPCFFLNSNVPMNNNTTVWYNAASVANGMIHKGKMCKLAGNPVKHNIIGDVRREVVDADNLDFRPTRTSKYIKLKVGPYEYNPTLTNYWIPGRQIYKASTPVPPDGSTNVNASSRDAVMWLNAYGAGTHHVFFGMSLKSVEKATTNSGRLYKGSAKDGGNVFYLQPLMPGKKYYWRVDAEVSAEEVHRGDVWSFTTKPNN